MFSKLGLYVAAAGVVAIGSLWVMHQIDEARYAKLQAQTAQSHARQLTRVIQERDKYAGLLSGAKIAAAAEKARREREAAEGAKRLAAALEQGRKNDATLDRCLSYKLPPGVLSTLPR